LTIGGIQGGKLIIVGSKDLDPESRLGVYKESLMGFIPNTIKNSPMNK
jgi:hypothetical protein